MDIAVVGTGYVGLVSGACLADFGHTVVCVDANPQRIDQLQRGEVPFFEPGLAELVQRNAGAGRLRFTTDMSYGIRDAVVILLAVGTPEGANGAADLSQIEGAVRSIAPHLDGRHRVVVTKSTVPTGTGRWLADLLQKWAPTGADVDVVSNPEFLREGSAVSDFMRPDRVVIGTSSERAASVMKEIYRPLYLIETPVLMTDVATAEMIKCASNAFLAVKISFMNEIANLCDRAGADVHGVAKGMGLDKRIGSKFLHPGPGFGGSCFPKDTRALVALGTELGVPQLIVEHAIEVNERQKAITFEKMRDALGGVRGRTVALLGLAFKPNTSDVREAPALYLCRALAEAGARVRACDPFAVDEARLALGPVAGQVTFVTDAYDAAAGADAVAIITEWNEYRSLDLTLLRDVMSGRVIVDARNVLDPLAVVAAGFTYHSTGRQSVASAAALV
jgi:UDPglucose 6-dehydrogenase